MEWWYPYISLLWNFFSDLKFFSWPIVLQLIPDSLREVDNLLQLFSNLFISFLILRHFPIFRETGLNCWQMELVLFSSVYKIIFSVWQTYTTLRKHLGTFCVELNTPSQQFLRKYSRISRVYPQTISKSVNWPIHSVELSWARILHLNLKYSYLFRLTLVQRVLRIRWKFHSQPHQSGDKNYLKLSTIRIPTYTNRVPRTSFSPAKKFAFLSLLRALSPCTHAHTPDPRNTIIYTAWTTCNRKLM